MHAISLSRQRLVSSHSPDVPLLSLLFASPRIVTTRIPYTQQRDNPISGSLGPEYVGISGDTICERRVIYDIYQLLQIVDRESITGCEMIGSSTGESESVDIYP